VLNISKNWLICAKKKLLWSIFWEKTYNSSKKTRPIDKEKAMAIDWTGYFYYCIQIWSKQIVIVFLPLHRFYCTLFFLNIRQYNTFEKRGLFMLRYAFIYNQGKTYHFVLFYFFFYYVYSFPLSSRFFLSEYIFSFFFINNIYTIIQHKII